MDRLRPGEYADSNKYSDDEFEDVDEAEAEASYEYRIPPASPQTMYRRMSIKARRTKASLQRNSKGRKEEQVSEIQELEAVETVTISSRRSKSNRKTSENTKSWIPVPVPECTRRTSVSTVSFQFDLKPKKSGSTTSLLRKRIGSQPSVIQRLNSAKDIHIKELSSKVRLLETTINDMTAENKTLQRQAQRQAVALRKYEGVEADFPRVLNYHQGEVKYLQQALRKAQSSCRKYESTIRSLNNRIVTLEDNNVKLRKLVESEELGERQVLQQRLIEITNQLDTSDERLADHGRQFDILQKSHSRQLAVIHGKFRESNRRVYNAEQELYRLNELIRQKDRVVSYLRMRTREPGLEPPLHRKIMEEHKSSYKYLYQVETSFESVNGEYYAPHRENSINSTQSPTSLGQDGSQGDDDQRQEQMYTLSAGSSTSSHAEDHDTNKYCPSSGKSNDSAFSEELARRSRERNLDVTYESEFEDDEIEQCEPQESEQEIQVVDIESEDQPSDHTMTTVTVMSAMDDADCGSGMTYVVPRKCHQEDWNAIEFQGHSYENLTFENENDQCNSTNQSEKGTPNYSEPTGQENLHPCTLSTAAIILESPQPHSLPKLLENSGFRLRKRRIRKPKVIDLYKQQNYEKDQPEINRSNIYYANFRTKGSYDESGGGSNSYMETGAAGDAEGYEFLRNHETPYYQSEVSLTTTAINRRDCDEESSETSADISEGDGPDPQIKYSEEEFYCESGGEQIETKLERLDQKCPITIETRNLRNPNDPISRSPTAIQSPRKQSRIFSLEKFFTFTSKPSYLGEHEETVVTSDDNRSGIISKHDSMLKTFTPQNSTPSSQRGTPQNTATSSCNSRKTTAGSKESTTGSCKSVQSLSTLHRNRPKGPTKQSCQSNRVEDDEESHNDKTWSIGDLNASKVSPKSRKLNRVEVIRSSSGLRKPSIGNVHIERSKPIRNYPTHLTST